jgi:hypothetical protein
LWAENGPALIDASLKEQTDEGDSKQHQRRLQADEQPHHDEGMVDEIT